ncbi:MAG: type II secretion system F family protein [Candidatus Dormibacteraeota bacterium]|nr:type II secretion system F family protein [Candidatus Dormibacteraeota bacterium]
MEFLLAAIAAAGAGIIFWGLVARDRALEEIEDPVAIPLQLDREASKRSMRETLAGPITRVATPMLRGQRGGQLQVQLNRAGLTIKAAEFAVIRLVSAAAVGVLAFLRFGNILVVLLGAVAGYMLPAIWLKRRQAKRRQAFEASLGDTVVLIANGVKAGYSIQQAFASVAEGGRPPLAEEMARVIRETSLGLDLEEALQHANVRLASKDFDLVVTAILIHRTVGGNLAEVLDKIAETIRERVRVHGEVRVLTAQARASGYIITALPFAVGGILTLISPGFETPLFKSPLGIAMLVVGMISISIGYAIIRKITDIHL